MTDHYDTQVPMSVDRACDWLVMMRNNCADATNGSQVFTAVDMAIKAFRSQQEEEKNEPLTWNELVSMCGEAVWVVENNSEYWAIVGAAFKPHDEFVYLIHGGDPDDCGCRSQYGAGLAWIAYRRPPKEENA